MIEQGYEDEYPDGSCLRCSCSLVFLPLLLVVCTCSPEVGCVGVLREQVVWAGWVGCNCGFVCEWLGWVGLLTCIVGQVEAL